MSEEMMNRRKLITLGSAAVAGSLVGVSLMTAEAQAAGREAARARRTAATWENLVEKTSFNSSTAFAQSWNTGYPWGDYHNGAAKMSPGKVTLSGGVLTLTATRRSTSGNEFSPSEPKAPIWYDSGAVHAKPEIIVNDQFPEYDIEGEFRATTGPGIWPAFWTNGITTWPPESDILEYVGDSTNLFNTWTTSGGQNQAKEKYELSGHDPSAWHRYRAWIYKEGDQVKIDYYFDSSPDGGYVVTHTADGWLDQPMNLIINLQMGTYASDAASPSSPGWATQPGPSGDTTFQARNVWFGRTRAY